MTTLQYCVRGFVSGRNCVQLTRSLPRDVYIRRQNDHPGGQGRIYTSHLNFVSTHLSKPGHRRGCCCMSPRCLLRQFVDRCLLFWAFFIEKTVLLCFARFLSKWRETALWLFPDATDDKLVRAVGPTFDGFRYDGDRGESSAGFVLLKARATNDGGYLLGEETSDGGAWGGGGGGNDHTSAVNEDLNVSTQLNSTLAWP